MPQELFITKEWKWGSIVLAGKLSEKLGRGF
jgi:hypothetical protein